MAGCIIRSVTDQMHAQRALREHAQRLRTLINATPDIICVKDGAGRWLVANDAMLKLLGLENVDYRRKTDFELAEEQPFHRDAFRTSLETDELAWQGGTLYKVEETIHQPDGLSKVCEMIKIPVFDATGERQELIVFGRDITERKHAEQQALQLALERERSAILSGFIRDTSHEFANPLSVIKNNVYLLHHRPEATRAQRLLDGIAGQVEFLEKLVAGLLTMSQLDSGIPFRFAPLDVSVLMRAMYETAESMSAKKGQLIQLVMADDLPEMLVDQQYMRRALRELIENAIQYTPAGGTITLSVALEPDQPDSPPHTLVIAVEDSGIGIAPDELPHIFGRFYRIDKARAMRGAGLGLPIAKIIAERHGGTLTVESAPGAGSTFRIFLPIHFA